MNIGKKFPYGLSRDSCQYTYLTIKFLTRYLYVSLFYPKITI